MKLVKVDITEKKSPKNGNLNDGINENTNNGLRESEKTDEDTLLVKQLKDDDLSNETLKSVAEDMKEE